MSAAQNPENFIGPDGRYTGPSMREAMEDLVGGFEDILQHNREHHPEVNNDVVQREFDQAVASLREMTKVGLPDTQATWEAVLTGFIYGARAGASIEYEDIIHLRNGGGIMDVPALLILQLAFAERWKAAGENTEDTLSGILAATESASGREG